MPSLAKRPPRSSIFVGFLEIRLEHVVHIVVVSGDVMVAKDRINERGGSLGGQLLGRTSLHVTVDAVAEYLLPQAWFHPAVFCLMTIYALGREPRQVPAVAMVRIVAGGARKGFAIGLSAGGTLQSLVLIV